MFSKAKTVDEANVVSLDDTKEEPKDSSRRGLNSKKTNRSRPAGVPTIISGDMLITGQVQSSGEVQFDGEIDGDIRAKGLVVGDGARVKGQVFAEKVRVAGIVDGAINAVEVELAATAQVMGDITHTSLSIENGARFEGNCRHSDNPLSGDAATTRKSTAQKSIRPVSTADASPEAPSASMADEPVEAELVEAEAVSSEEAPVSRRLPTGHQRPQEPSGNPGATPLRQSAETEGEATPMPRRPQPRSVQELMPARRATPTARPLKRNAAPADLR